MRLVHEAMCSGPNKERADFYKMMTTFYELSKPKQRIWMAAVEEMFRQNEQEQGK